MKMRCLSRQTPLLSSTSKLSRATSFSVGREYCAAPPSLPPTDLKPDPYVGASVEEVRELRESFLSPALFHYYKKPLMIVQGKMQYLWDNEGRRYLDTIGGIVTISVGHCHPKVVEAGIQQMKKLQHTTTIYYHPEIAQFGRELAAKLPDQLKVLYFVNSGSEANDLAMLMARVSTGNNEFIALRNGYHGMSVNTMGLTALHTWKYNVAQGFGVHHALNPDTYRGPYGPEVPDVGKKYADDVKDLILTGTSGQLAGFIAESIQGVGGTIIPPEGCLSHIYKYVRAAGGLCVADEVQTGFGRTGEHYWGFQNHGIVPDIVTMAKGIGNGAPLAAVATTPEIAKSLTKRIHFNTFGGNPVSCAMGRAVLQVIEEEGLQQNSLEIGKLLKERLNDLKTRHEIIGDVRGRGLMIGMELVKDRKTKEPASNETALIFEKAKDYGLLLGKGGLYGNVFRIKPPMCITKADVEFIVDVMDRSIKEVVKEVNEMKI